MKTLEQLKYEPVPIPAAPKAPRTENRQVNGEMLADQMFTRKTFQPFRPTLNYEQLSNVPSFEEMEPLARQPYIPLNLRRDVHAAGASQLPLHLR